MLLLQNTIWSDPYWFGDQYRKINIQKEDFTVISVKDIHKKNCPSLLQPQRLKPLPAATVGFTSPTSAAADTINKCVKKKVKTNFKTNMLIA